MAEAKTYPTLEIASAACGIGLCDMTFSRLHEIATHASGLDIFSHEMGHRETMDRVRAEIHRNLPDMPTRADAEADWKAAAAKATTAYGDSVAVPAGALERESHPMATLNDMLAAKPAA